MKILTLTTFFITCFAMSNYSQETIRASYEKELKMTLVLENAKEKSCDGIIYLYLTNQSKTDKYKIVLPGDGSESAWREPYVYFTADFKAENGKWKQLKKNGSLRCGLFDAEWQKDTIKISPAQKIQIYKMASENIIKFFDTPSNGIIRLTAHYDYKQGRNPKEHANEIPKDYKNVIEQQNLENIKNIPSFVLTSGTIEINIKK